MKLNKFILSTLITFGASVLSNNAIAGKADEQLMPYLLSAAETYIVPKLSRDLGKNVQVKSNPYKTPSLELVISNATCDDYFFSVGGLNGQLYIVEHIMDKYEEDKTFTKQKLNEYISKPLSTFSLIQNASTVLAASVLINPDVLVKCGGQGDTPPAVENKIKSFLDAQNKRAEKLKSEGRF